MAYNPKLQEAEIKNKVAADLFPSYDCTRILGNIDFCVQPKDKGPMLWETESLLWAEAKAGVHTDFAPLFAQLVLTIGGEKTFEEHSPPPFLGAFDSEKIAFLPWHVVLDLFSRSDINFSTTPSNWTTPAFEHVRSLVRPLLTPNMVLFRFSEDAADLAKFIRRNLHVGNSKTHGLPVTRNNFPFVYQKWLAAVKPSIAVNWDLLKKQGILDADFFLADLLSKDNTTLLQNLFVVLRKDHYLADRTIDPSGILSEKRVEFKDGQKAHALFWNHYQRPPRKVFWTFIHDRRDLLMPLDIRERQGSFFTPQIWVEKAQESIAAVLGENWQEDHYVWDPAGGTGNLLAGLDPKSKYRVWISTLQKGDVSIIRERIKGGTAALLDSHVFQFDFLNDSFENLPKGLKEIIQNPEKRKQLVVLLNPPYAEATTATTVTGTGQNKPEVAKGTAVHSQYKSMIGQAANEMFALFLIRIAKEIPGSVLGQFSTLKHILGSNFERFRKVFESRLEKAFIVPARTFDNVDSDFPIGFFVWHTAAKEPKMEGDADVFDGKGTKIGTRRLFPLPYKRINPWIKTFDLQSGKTIGFIGNPAPDFQHCGQIYISEKPGKEHFRFIQISSDNLIPVCVYLAVRFCMDATWQNNRDQFLWPEDSWKTDWQFQLDCVTFTLFHTQNHISCKAGVNHWIPFTEDEVGATDSFASHFMSDWLQGKKDGASHTHEPIQTTIDIDGIPLAADVPSVPYDAPLAALSPAARAVFDTGRELWRYYHAQPNAMPDASLYDIREHFKGRKPNGHMNGTSSDAGFNTRNNALISALKTLAAQITPKVYEHGFLRN